MSALPAATVTPPIPRPLVLILADEGPLQSSYTRFLRSTGFEVDTVSSCPELEARLAEGRSFDVVLGEVWWRGASVFDALPALRRRAPDVPVVLLASTPTIETALGALEHGVYRYLCRPLAADHLASELLAAARHGAEARHRRDVAEAADRARSDTAFLDEALAGLWLAAQPIVRASNRKVYAYEMLLRTRGSTPYAPTAVLAAAELSGRLPELGRSIRAEAAARLQGMPPGTRIFVNLHPYDLLDDSLVGPDDPLRPFADRVTYEITERARLGDRDRAVAACARLRGLGFRLALDDLGAGYSGLASLVDLAPEVVKLDMSLVRGIDGDPVRTRLVRGIAGVCKELDIEVVCEGVETPKERDALLAIGIDLLQGYLFARPAVGAPGIRDEAFQPAG